MATSPGLKGWKVGRLDAVGDARVLVDPRFQSCKKPPKTHTKRNKKTARSKQFVEKCVGLDIFQKMKDLSMAHEQSQLEYHKSL